MENENRSETERYQKARSEFFHHLALQHLPEMRLLLRGGKLWKRDEWRNIAEHSIVQVAAAEVLSNLLQLPQEDKKRLVRVALVHDWVKRRERKPDQFSQEERQQAQKLLAKVEPDENLMHATGPDFIEKASVKGKSTFLERLQFIIDDITAGSEIVNFDQRIDEVEARRQDLNENEEYTRRLGQPYWQAERRLGHQVLQEIFDRLREKGVEIDTPEKIPDLINSELDRRIMESASP